MRPSWTALMAESVPWQPMLNHYNAPYVEFQKPSISTSSHGRASQARTIVSLPSTCLHERNWEVEQAHVFQLNIFHKKQECIIHFPLIAPVDLKLDVLSKTSVKATVIPPSNSGATYYIVHFGDYTGYCSVWFSQPGSCFYKDLKPGQVYRFTYSLGADPGGLDISSETRIKPFTMPS